MNKVPKDSGHIIIGLANELLGWNIFEKVYLLFTNAVSNLELALLNRLNIFYNYENYRDLENFIKVHHSRSTAKCILLVTRLGRYLFSMIMLQ